MAKDVITRFKLETTGFDSKIKEAAKELSAYSKTATQAKEGFNQFTKANVDAARALGSMATSTTNAKDRAKELVGAFNDAAKAYNALTKEQQQSDWAKALAGSLTQLQQRIKEAKNEMQGLGDGMKGGGGLFSGIGSKMEGALAVFGGNLMTKAAGAIASLGSEMYDTVRQGIELARQGEGIRIAFERLGRGDILDGLRQATHGTVTDIELMKAAVKFNDFKLPLDELGTMLAFAQQKAKDTGQSVDYMVDSIVTGLGRKSLMILDNLGLSATEVKDRMKETGDMTKAVGAIIREQMAKAGDYVETAADRAAQANVSLQNKMEELGRKFAPLQEASNSLWTSMKIGILDIVGGPLAQLLNGLTQAGRMANAYGKMGGSGKVGRMTANLAGASEQNRQSIYQQQQQQFWRYINPREQQIRDIRAWQSGQRGEALKGRIGAIRDKYGSLDATKIQAEVDAAKKMLADYQAAAKQILQPIQANINTSGTEQSITSLTKKLKDLQEQRKKAIAAGDTELSKDLAKQITQTKADIKGLGGAIGGGGKTKTPQTELQQNQAKINELTQQYVDIMATASKAGEPLTDVQKEQTEEIQKQIQELEKRNGLLGMYAAKAKGLYQPQAGDFDKNVGKFETINPFAEDNKAMEMTGTLKLQLDEETMNAVNEQILKNIAQDGKAVEESWKRASSAIGTVSGAISQIEDPAAKIVGTIGQAIATIALAYAENLAKDKSSNSNIYAFIAAAAATTISLATTIASIHNSTGYAEGGIIKGNSFSGDMIPADSFVNAGELVLNRAQQGALASMIRDNERNGGGSGVSYITGEQICVVIDRYLARTGRGELVTWK